MAEKNTQVACRCIFRRLMRLRGFEFLIYLKILNIEILNYLNNRKYTLKVKLKLPVGGGKSLILSLNH